MAKIAFLGLGVMGFPMAGHIAVAGHDVTVYNRTSAKAEAWAAQHGGAHAATPAAAATGADFVLGGTFVFSIGPLQQTSFLRVVAS